MASWYPSIWQYIFPPYTAFLWYAAHLHLHWAVWMWLTPEIVKTTPFWGVYAFCGQQYWLTCLILVAASASTICLMLLRVPRRWHILLGSPQQLLLFLSMSSCLHAAAIGMYADGTPHSKMFIFSDQMPTILAAPIHACALLGFHWSRYTHPDWRGR